MPTVQEVWARQQEREREVPPDVAAALAADDTEAFERLLAAMPVDAAQRVRVRIDAERQRLAAERERAEHQERASELQRAVEERGRAAQVRIAHWRKVRRDVEDVAAEARVARDQAVRVGDVGAAVESQLRVLAAQGLIASVEDATAAETGRRAW